MELFLFGRTTAFRCFYCWRFWLWLEFFRQRVVLLLIRHDNLLIWVGTVLHQLGEFQGHGFLQNARRIA